LRALMRTHRSSSSSSSSSSKLPVQEELLQTQVQVQVRWEDILQAWSRTRSMAHRSTLNFSVTEPTVKLSQVGGYSAVKLTVCRAAQQITHAATLQRLGVHPSSGVLFYGPSGCGKTMFAQALAHELGYSVISASASDLYSKYLGESESMVRALFRQANDMSPCVLLLEQVDCVGGSRDSSAGSDVEARVLSTFLNAMDGVDTKKGVVVVGCTDRLSALDPALTRPGRFDQLILVDVPTQEDRQDILHRLGRRHALADDVDLCAVAARTAGFTGADLSHLLRESAIEALRQDRDADIVAMRHVEAVLAGLL